MTRKEERELAFTLIFEKIFNDELTIEEISNMQLRQDLLKKTLSHSH